MHNHNLNELRVQQTRDFHSVSVYYWANVADGGPTVKKHWGKVAIATKLTYNN